MVLFFNLKKLQTMQSQINTNKYSKFHKKTSHVRRWCKTSGYVPIIKRMESNRK